MMVVNPACSDGNFERVFEVKYLLLFSLGYLSVQRFLLSELYAFFCLIPLVYFCVTFVYSRRIAYSSVVLALLMSVDNGGEVYTETLSIFRYAIWVCALFSIIYPAKYFYKTVIYYVILLIPLLTLTLINVELVHFPSLLRDIFLCVVIFFVVTKSQKSLMKVQNHFSLRPILFFMIGVLIGEVYNAFLYDPTEYSNYDSLKSFIVFPSLYFLLNKKYFVGLICVLLTLFVMVAFVSRMIFFAYFIALLVILFRLIFSSNFTLHAVYGVILGAFLFLGISSALDYLQDSTKITSLFFMVSDNFSGSLVDVMQLVDRVRYYELLMIFDSSWYAWLFGNGLGTGFIDSKNYFDFLGWHAPAAFSDEELRSGFFYSFHDVWTDVGYRFGLLPILGLMTWLLMDRFHQNRDTVSMRLTVFILLLCSFWTVSGVLLIGILIILIRSSVLRR